MASVYKVSFPDNNGSCKLTKTINGSTINIEYEFNALSRRHLFTIENEGFEVKGVLAQTGGCLNEAGKNICKIFVVVHSPIFDGVRGYCEEFPAGSLELLLMSYDTMKNYFNSVANTLENL